jgi:hypothetical protein
MRRLICTSIFGLLLSPAAAAQTEGNPNRNIGQPGCNPGVPTRLAKTATQENPEYGDISEITQCKSVYVFAADYEARQRIVKEIEKDKSLRVVSSDADADFFIEYGAGAYTRGATVSGNQVNKNDSLVGEFRVTVRGQIDDQDRRHQRIVWGKRNTQDFVNGITFSRNPEVNLAREFLKALKKARGGK